MRGKESHDLLTVVLLKGMVENDFISATYALSICDAVHEKVPNGRNGVISMVI